MLKDKKLKKETKDAAKAEQERRERIDERQKLVSFKTIGRHVHIHIHGYLWKFACYFSLTK